jgi:FkbM family methyltransferase
LKLFVERAISYWHVSGIISFLIDGYSLRLFANADDALTSKIFYKKNWENHVISWFIFFSKRSQLIIDAGANIGIYSLAASYANPFANIYAFEPNPNNLDRLRRNIFINGMESKVLIQPMAIGEKDGEIDIYLPEAKIISDVTSVFQSHSTSFNHFKHNRISVQCVSLDSFFSKRNSRIGLLKIDVELYELYVLKGMRRIIENDRPIIFCEIFNDEIKRKQNSKLANEIPIGYTKMISVFLKSFNYHFYSITSIGLIEVDDFTYAPMSSMYLLLPKQLLSKFYLFSERESIAEQL